MMVQAFINFASNKIKEGYPADVLGWSLIMAGISVSIRAVGVSAMAAWLQGQVNYLRSMEAAERQEAQEQPLSTSKAA
jgi:uncharacterized oligopeptide transporter (OPT) family protein